MLIIIKMILEVTRIVHGIRVRFGNETAEEESLAALVGLL